MKHTFFSGFLFRGLAVAVVLCATGVGWWSEPVFGKELSFTDDLLYLTTRERADHDLDQTFEHVMEFSYSDIVKRWQYKFDLTAHLDDDPKAYINEAWIGNSLVDIGKKKWNWGYGYSFSPTYLLDDNRGAYWGTQVTYILSNYGISLGMAYDNKKSTFGTIWSTSLPYDAKNDFTSSGIGEFGISWLRGELKSDNYDCDLDLVYQRDGQENEYLNFGAELSRDLKNGWEVYGGANIRNKDSDSRWLLGGQYTGAKFVCITEYYRNWGKAYFFIDFNNTGSLFNHWQWEANCNLDLEDSGQYYELSVKYFKWKKITPEMIIQKYAGPPDSALGKFPLDLTLYAKVTLKFL